MREEKVDAAISFFSEFWKEDLLCYSETLRSFSFISLVDVWTVSIHLFSLPYVSTTFWHVGLAKFPNLLTEFYVFSSFLEQHGRFRTFLHSIIIFSLNILSVMFWLSKKIVKSKISDLMTSYEVIWCHNQQKTAGRGLSLVHALNEK